MYTIKRQKTRFFGGQSVLEIYLLNTFRTKFYEKSLSKVYIMTVYLLKDNVQIFPKEHNWIYRFCRPQNVHFGCSKCTLFTGVQKKRTEMYIG